MVGEGVPIFLSVIWPLFSSKGLYKAHKSPNTSPQEVECCDNSLPGRHSPNCPFTKRNGSCKGYIGFSMTKSGISDKCQKIEVSSSTLSEDRIPESDCGFKRNDQSLQ